MGFNAKEALEHQLTHESIVVCLQQDLVRVQSWSRSGPYWLVDESLNTQKETDPGRESTGDVRSQMSRQKGWQRRR